MSQLSLGDVSTTYFDTKPEAVDFAVERIQQLTNSTEYDYLSHHIYYDDSAASWATQIAYLNRG